MPVPLSRLRLPHLALPSYLTLPTAFLIGILLTLYLPSLTPFFRPYLHLLYRSWRARPSDRNAIAGAGLRRGIKTVDMESRPETSGLAEGAGEGDDWRGTGELCGTYAAVLHPEPEREDGLRGEGGVGCELDEILGEGKWKKS